MVLSGLLAFLLTLSLIRGRAETFRIAVAGRDIAAGTKVTPEEFRFVDVGGLGSSTLRTFLQPGTLGEVSGWVAATSISEGDPVTRSEFRPPSAPGGLEAMSVPLDPDLAVGGALAPGDVVDVIAVQGGTASYLVRGAQVLAVHSGAVAGLGAGSSGFSVTIAVDSSSALAIAAAISAGNGAVQLVRSTGAAPQSAQPPPTGAASPTPSPGRLIVNEPVIAAVYSPREWLERLERFLVDHGGARLRTKVVDRGDALDEAYDVLVVDDFTPFLSPRFVDELHRHGRRVLGVFDPDEVGGEEHLSGGKERLRQCGVDEVIESPAPPSEFVAALGALAMTSGARLTEALGLTENDVALLVGAEPPEPRGFVTAVGSPSGGCGATEVAVALANALAARGEDCVLVDCDDVSPSIAQRLGLSLYPNLRSAVEAVEEGTEDLDRSLVAVPEGGFRVLPGLSRPRDWAGVRPLEVAGVIECLARTHQQVVLNVGHRLEDLAWLGEPERYGLSREAVRGADSIVGVVSAAPSGVTRLLEWALEVHSLAPGAPLHVVVNRAPRSPFKREELAEESSRALAPHSVSFLPRDGRVEQAAWDARPVVGGPFTKAVAHLAATAVPRLAPQPKRRLFARSPR